MKIFYCAAAGLDLSRTEVVGSGRACQRPRTSSDAKCFSCEGALAKDPQIFKFLAYIASFFQNPCCAARGHALAVFHLLAQPALAALGLRSEKKLAPPDATNPLHARRNKNLLENKKSSHPLPLMHS